jgi:hypothetical protein
MSKKKNGENKALQIVDGLWGSFRYGIKSFLKNKILHFFNAITLISFWFVASYKHTFLKSDFFQIKESLPAFFFRLLTAIPWEVHFYLGLIFLFVLWFIILGVKQHRTIKDYQKKIERTGIRGADGSFFHVVSADCSDGFKTTLVLKSVGIGLDKYQVRKEDLESSFAQEIDSITTGSNPQIIILNLTKRKLPKMVSFSDLEPSLIKPHSFIIGESMSGVVTRTIESLPHMLIAGTTGGGKSVFFKQMLLGLLKTTPHLQLYLLDLKRGVEMKDFAVLPNVQVAKNENEAVKMLQSLRDEMERRFSYMEQHGHREIDPKRDKMDKIVIGIDEASVIYTKTKSNNGLSQKAREITDDLAKLARVTGIHLILATQKVSKETIDTKVQENIGGRVCFKMNTLVNSLTVIGNKMAYSLPDVAGRAIWASGNTFLEIQAPFMSDEQFKEEIEIIGEEFKNNSRKCYSKMLTVSSAPKSNNGIINLEA